MNFRILGLPAHGRKIGFHQSNDLDAIRGLRADLGLCIRPHCL